MTKKKVGLILVVTAIALPLIFLFAYEPSFTAKGAVEKHFEYENDLQYLNKIEAGNFQAWLFNDEEEGEYKTFLVKKDGLFYESPLSTYIEHQTDASLETLSSIDYTDETDALTLLVVQSMDPDVDKIEAGEETNRKENEVEEGEISVFSWDRSISFDEMNAAAYDGQGEVLYYFGLEKDETTNVDNLGWFEEEK
ncbi:hypothetical protein GCM10010954_11290 [Halobacillus andaensis]|uniref:Uncharacterized protein n=1 Tax=Halobacillus andaensis TaxID=1176239 RepID=A0A917B2R3_HALAA|nr:hypothetical protein [Halobacillus andaensis]MBP2003924.1 hypothetical protein [Halobacillus andaensis]GGF14395.1 hypothetical protein GCM10010954_11290 [Halobacillus andaensis]